MTVQVAPPRASVGAGRSTSATRPGDARLPYAPGLDGVRALAVALVLAFHAGVAALPGGFVGVDVFFVISGFLITSLLLADSRSNPAGRVDLGRFYLRRARRLLPALYLLLVGVTAYVALFLREELAQLRGQVVSALLYVTNWYFIAHEQSYFEALGRPPLLLNLWSLAVEEQYYIVWALVLAVVLPRLLGRRRPLATGLVAGILVSALVMALLYDPFGDPSRVYYSTLARAAPLLVGSLLALYWVPGRLRTRVAPGARVLVDLAGVVGAAGVVWVAATAHASSTWMFRGGFLAVAVLSALVVASVVHPAGRFGAVMGARPLVWVGVRSYALYLWHWPVFMLTRPELDVPVSGLPLLALRLGLTVLLADVSYRYVEVPLRHGALSRWLASVRAAATRSGPAPRPRVLWVGAAAVMAALLAQQLWVAGPGPDPRVGPGAAGARQVQTAAAGSTRPGAAGQRVTHSGGPLRVTVVGDSQGMTLLLNVPPRTSRTFSLVDGTVEGCGVLEGRIQSSQGMRRDLGSECRGWAATWHRNVARSHPQVVLVMIGAWEVFDTEVDGTWLRFGTPGWDAYFVKQLDKGIAAVAGPRVTVALAELPCYRPVDGGGLSALPERGDDSRTRHVNTLLRQVAAAHPASVHTVTPPPQFCTDPAVARDRSYRWDGVHYYKPGAALFMRVVGPQLLRLPLRG